MGDNLVAVGIDPGLTGAIVTWFPGDDVLVVHDMPTVRIRGRNKVDEDRLLDLLVNEIAFADVVVIEKVGGMPGQGVASTAAFMRGAGFIVGAVQGLARTIGDCHPEVREVTPAQWKLEMGVVVPRNATRIARKNASRERAKVLLPKHAGHFVRAKDDGRAEAALLAMWGVGSI